MLASQIPSKFAIPFGNNAAAGTIRAVPQASQSATTPGAASLYDGFPTITGQPLASGGIPPSMQDFNGILNQITAWSRYQAAGGQSRYDAAFVAQIGGYPRGALLNSSTPNILWLSTVDSNMTDPDSGSASGWVSLAQSQQFASSLSSTGGFKCYADASSPTGRIIENWGYATITTANQYQSVTFPLSFPNSILNIANSFSSIGSYGGAAGQPSGSLNGIYVWANNAGAVVGWLAKGY